MHLSPQEVKELKESLKNVKVLGQRVYKLLEERDREIDILDRRLSFLSHPAGKARKDGAPLNHINTSDNVVDILSKKEN